MDIDNKQVIIDNFIQINKKLINESNIKYITNKINMNIVNCVSNEPNYRFIKNLKYNQDLIIANITMFLMKRYIYFENFDTSYENKEYEIMKKILSKNILYKYMKIINDINNIYDYKYYEISPIVITKSMWHFDYSKGYQKLKYSIEDNNNNSSFHIIQFFLHLGEIVTDFKTNKGTFNIRMLPIHYEIINHPNTIDNILIDYNKEYINFIFKQLLENDILEMTNKYKDGKFQINKDYDGGDLDLIKLSNEALNTTNNIDTVIQKEVSLERKEIIMANINSVLKKYESSIKISDLFIKIKENLSIYFDTEQEYFDNIILEMVDKDYISIDDNNSNHIKKLIY